MEALWAALYARLTPALDLWRGKAPPEYKGSPDGSPYLVGSLALSVPPDDGGYLRIATLTIDGDYLSSAAAPRKALQLTADLGGPRA